MNARTSFASEEIEAISPMEKFAIVATEDPDGQPHLSLISSLIASGPRTMTIGEFAAGASKRHMQERPQISFGILTLKGMRYWSGKARWTGLRRDGPELDVYKETPMHRYNAYFPVHTVHYLDLVEVSGGAKLDMAGMLVGAVRTALVKKSARRVGGRRDDPRVLKPYGRDICDAFIGLKFLSFPRADGFPALVPLHQCQAADASTLVFAYPRAGIEGLEAGMRVALFASKLNGECVLVRGIFRGQARRGLLRAGTIELDWAYNAMPTNTEQIYPPKPLIAVTDFGD